MFRGGAVTADGQTLVIFGLSKENIRRIQADEPIMVELEQWNLPGVKVMIFAGDTEESMATELAALIGPDTKVSVDDRLFKGGD